MSSKHESALAMIDDQIEKEEKSRKDVEADMLRAKAELERKERELKLVDWSLEQLRGSRNALALDRAANTPPVPVVSPADLAKDKVK